MNPSPIRVYVDTSLVSADARGQLDATEQRAYDTIKIMRGNGEIEFWSSHVVTEELGGIPEAYRAPHSALQDGMPKVSSNVTWVDEELVPDPLGGGFVEEEIVEDQLFTALQGLLRDYNDARHLAHAKLYGIDIVLTVDERSILRLRDELRERFGIRVFKPSEFVAAGCK